MINLEEMGQQAKQAALQVAQLSTTEKNEILNAMAMRLVEKQAEIIAANELDLQAAQAMPAKFIDRLVINEARINDMAVGLKQVVNLPDPIGNIDGGWVNKAGLKIEKRRVPLGVVGMIYEARPNVTVDASALCFKSGNAVILRGGKEALQTNVMIASILREVLKEQGIDQNAIQVITDPSHDIANKFMQMNKYVDVLIPRGSARLIQAVVNNAKVPVIETGAGNCHIYVDASADLTQAVKIVVNAKCQRPSVCNSLEKLLVNREIANEFLPMLQATLNENQTEIRGTAEVIDILGDQVVLAHASDWDEEYNDFILTIKIVDSIDEAISHIERHSTHHSEAILTSDYNNSQKFLNEVNSACVYVNASTRFTDGFEFGFGAEIGISTQKLHARGPMGLNELTTTKYTIEGNGQIRK